MQQHTQQITTDKGTVNVTLAGAGKRDVLCLHGWPQSSALWQPLLQHMGKADCRFIMPDLPGFAASAEQEVAYDVMTQARYLEAVVAELDIARCDVVGHNIGGPIGLALAYLAQDKVQSLAMVEAPFWGVEHPDLPELVQLYWSLQMQQDVDMAMSMMQGREERYLQHFFRGIAARPDAICSERLTEYVNNMRKPGALRASLGHYQAVPESKEQLASLSQNKLEIPVMGLGAKMVMGDYCYKAARQVSNKAVGGVIHDCGHWIPEERPDILAKALSQFWH